MSWQWFIVIALSFWAGRGWRSLIEYIKNPYHWSCDECEFRIRSDDEDLVHAIRTSHRRQHIREKNNV